MVVKAVDLFCGIGGLTHGLEKANIPVVAGIDIDNSCEYAYTQNNNCIFINKNVEEVTGEEIRMLLKDADIKILVGCAPCQPFSRYSIRYRKNGEFNDKWGLIYSFERLVREVHPDIVSMENVPQLVNEKVFNDFVGTLKRLKYYIYYKIVYCPDYGVPQHRKRLVLLASRLGEISLVKPLYSKNTYRTVKDAIGHLPKIKAGEICKTDSLHRASALSKINLRRIEQSKPGGTWRDWDDDLKLKCHKQDSGATYPSVYGRMEWDKPAPTITTQFYGYGNGRFGHPVQNRAISLREGAILQSFPDGYVFMDNMNPMGKRKLSTHIGNAVPVELGKAIGESIREHIKLWKGEHANDRKRY